MSKSKKNTIDPESIIENYGADSVRLFILSDSPPEKDVQWSEQGMVASFKFLQKLWFMHTKILEKVNINQNDISSEKKLEKFVNNIIYKFNYNLEKFNYNVLVASLYETYNFLNEIINSNINGKILLNNYEKILIIISPLIPHFASECLENLNTGHKIEWPKIDESKLKTDQVNFIIQIDGKKRGNLLTKLGINEKDLLVEISKEDKLKKYLEKKEIKKTFFVKNKLINILIK